MQGKQKKQELTMEAVVFTQVKSRSETVNICSLNKNYFPPSWL